MSVASNRNSSRGTAVNDTLNASRIVINRNKETEKVLKDLYEPFSCATVATNQKLGMIKYASNDFWR